MVERGHHHHHDHDDDVEQPQEDHELIGSRRKRERVWAGALLHNFLAKTVSETTHARYLTIATSVASLFRRVEPACNTEMH